VKRWSAGNPGDLRVRQGGLSHLDFADEVFDAILLNEVIEHVDDERAVLRELQRVLKRGGLLFVFAPNRFHSESNRSVNGCG
jgi:ubiquinone/menaquinone biosynthesis C-methylase UbiE